MDRIFNLADRYIVGGFALVAAYLILTHPTAVNGLLQNGFGGVNAGFKILQGR